MKKIGYVSILGKPNVGKSTLLNHLLRQKISIVSPKPQTTRHRIMGILNQEGGQILFLDTPGIFEPTMKLHQRMVHSAFKTLEDADLILVMVEPVKCDLNGNLLSSLLWEKKKTILAINKIDTVPKETLLPLIKEYQEIFTFDEIIPISALKSDGLDVLLKAIYQYLPEGEPYYPEEMVSENPEKFFVQEIIREKIFLLYGEEVPYSSTVVIEEFKEEVGRKDFIRAILYVEKESQKPILIGKKGDSLKRVGKMAREEIEAFLGRPVYLELWVKIRKNWRKREEDLREFGY